MGEDKKKYKKVYFVVFIIFVILLLAVLYYFVFYGKDKVQASSEEVFKNIEEESMVEKEKEEIDISDWKTYESEEYGYSLKYPEGWNKTKVDPNRFLLKKTYKEFSPQVRIGGELIVDVATNTEGLSLEEWVNKNEKLYENSELKSKKEIKIGNKIGLERVIILALDRSEYRDIFIENSNFIFNIQPNITARFPDKEAEKEYKKIIDVGNKELEGILDTIKFQ